MTEQSDYVRSKQVFLQVLDAAPGDREPTLNAACGDDRTLRSAVLRLLDAHERSGPSLAEAPARTAAEAVEQFDAGPLRPGEVVASYTVVRILGAGAMGIVYEARQERTARSVALKIIRPTLGGRSAHRRFLDEGRALARLQHPGIAQVFEAGIAPVLGFPTPFLAMELVLGRSLAEHCGGLSRAQRLELLARLADAAHHAHLRGVVHRDLKPANVVVTEDGNPKILDFGIAKIAADDGDTVRTRHGEVIGTPAYMSPEQRDGNPEAIDHRTDVYALGVILRELLLPESTPEVHVRARRAFLPRGELGIIVGRATEPQRDRRYASAQALADDIRRHLSSRPVLARRPSRLYVGLRFAQRNRVPVALAALVLVALLVGLIGIAVKGQQARVSAQRATERFNDVRQIARVLLFDIHDRLLRIPGTTGARRHLVDTVQRYLDQLASDPDADDELLSEIGQAYIKLGDALGYQYAPNLGDRAAAQRAYSTGLSILRSLSEAQSFELETRLALATGIVHSTAIANYIEEDAAAVLLQVEEGNRLLRALAAEYPNDHRVAAELIRTAQRKALLHKNVVPPSLRLQLLREANNLAEQWQVKGKEHAITYVVHADVLNWLGYYEFEARDPHGVEASLASIELCERALALAPGHPQARYIQACVLGNLSRWHASLGRRQEALAYSNESLSAIQSLSDDDVLDLRSFRSRGVLEDFAGDVRVMLAREAKRSGQIEVARGDLHAASQHYQAHLEILNQRRDMGWLYPWEAGYFDHLREAMNLCKTMLAELP